MSNAKTHPFDPARQHRRAMFHYSAYWGAWSLVLTHRCNASPAYRSTAEESIYIADGFRGQGAGRALLGAILGEARALILHVVMAGIVACQEASLALHRSLGFVEAGRYRHMGFKLGSWHDVHWYQRHLWE